MAKVSDVFFIFLFQKNPSVARVSDFFLFSQESQSEFLFCFLFEGGGSKGGLASVSEFALQRIQI